MRAGFLIGLFCFVSSSRIWKLPSFYPSVVIGGPDLRVVIYTLAKKRNLNPPLLWIFPETHTSWCIVLYSWVAHLRHLNSIHSHLSREADFLFSFQIIFGTNNSSHFTDEEAEKWGGNYYQPPHVFKKAPSTPSSLWLLIDGPSKLNAA